MLTLNVERRGDRFIGGVARRPATPGGVSYSSHHRTRPFAWVSCRTMIFTRKGWYAREAAGTRMEELALTIGCLWISSAQRRNPGRIPRGGTSSEEAIQGAPSPKTHLQAEAADDAIRDASADSSCITVLKSFSALNQSSSGDPPVRPRASQ